MKYLLIGGAGFIGINCAEKLLARGDEVTIFDNFSRRGSNENVDWIKSRYPSVKIIVGDIRNIAHIEKLKKVIEDTDVIYHLAAQVAVTTSVKDPREDFEINALGTFNILEAVRTSSNQPIVIYASTNKVYGGMEDIEIIEQDGRYAYKDLPNGIPENRLLDFHSPYGCSKGAGDQYVRDYARIYGLKTAVMRQSCIYGPRQFGIEDQGWVAWFTIAALLDKKITVYGDGKQVRDVLYIDDLFEAYDIAVKNIDKVSGEIFNIGGGISNTMSLLELIAFLEEFLDKKVSYSLDDWRPGDQQVYVSDISKADKVLSWFPQTGVKDGVKKLSEWVKVNQELFLEM